MVRTQVQLTYDQSVQLKAWSAEENISIAELIRQSVDLFLERRRQPDRAELKRRALSVVGKYSSELSDIGENHDEYLADAYAVVGE